MSMFEGVAQHPALAEMTILELQHSSMALRAAIAYLFTEPRSPEEVREMLGATEHEHQSEAI